jgi:VWFA-related protein
MRAVIDALGPADRAALVTFSERLHTHTSLTNDRARLRTLLDRVTAGGHTALLDATFAGLTLRESGNARTLLLLFTDGHDTASWLSARKVLDAAQRTDVVVYPVTARVITLPLVVRNGTTVWRTDVPPLPPRIRARLDVAERLLEAFADDTGGRVVNAETQNAVRDRFLEVLAEFRQRYVLSYTPVGVERGGWHAIQVGLTGRNGQVRARRGYFASRITPDEASRTRSK